jgi:hypothetical protein
MSKATLQNIQKIFGVKATQNPQTQLEDTEMSKSQFNPFYNEIHSGVHPSLSTISLSGQYCAEIDLYMKKAINRYLQNELKNNQKEADTIRNVLLGDVDNGRCAYSRRMSLESLYGLGFQERVQWIKEHQKELIDMITADGVNVGGKQGGGILGNIGKDF